MYIPIHMQASATKSRIALIECLQDGRDKLIEWESHSRIYDIRNNHLNNDLRKNFYFHF